MKKDQNILYLEMFSIHSLACIRACAEKREKQNEVSISAGAPRQTPGGEQEATLGASLRRSERCSGSNGVISTLAGRPCPAPAASRGEPTAGLAAESQAKIPVAAPVHN